MSNKKRIYIRVRGCDDTTQFFIDLTEQEIELIKRLAAITEKISTYGCMPTIAVDENKELYEDAVYEQ
jgi:hypothetical protein